MNRREKNHMNAMKAKQIMDT